MDMEKRKSLCTVDGSVEWMYNAAASMENIMEFPQKVNSKTTIDPIILFLDIYLKELKFGAQRDVCHCSNFHKS